MLDPSGIFDFPKRIFIGIARVLWWLAWDFCVENIAWSTGWVALRLITFGRYPQAPLFGGDRPTESQVFFVHILGLVVLAIIILVLCREWPLR